MPSRVPVSGVVLSFLAFVFSVLFPAMAHADVCSAPANAIVAENCQPGNPSTQWDITGSGDSTIQGYATDISVNRGQTVLFKVMTDASSYHIDIYRIGYYGGMGARLIATVTPSASLPQTQPACLTDATTGLTDCGNWAISASWNVPSTTVSGVYIARLVRDDTGGASHIVFIVRDDGGSSDILYQVSDTTWTAYNDYGGNSLYAGSPVGRAYKVSYNRPNIVRGGQYARTWFFADEYPMVRWLEANGYDVSYSSGMDTDRFGANLKLHRVWMSSGHDEYWSGNQRANVEAARAAGIHLAFFSGNEIFWKTRWENSIDGSNTPYRTLVSYKETHANAVIDPQDPPTWTGTWRDPRFSPPADGGRPENALSGTIFMVNCCSALSIIVPAEDGKMRFWRNTAVATQAAGGSFTLGGAVIGYEWDEELDNGLRPAGLFHLSTTPAALNGQLLLDFGSTYGNGNAVHNMTMYKAPSGALVFGAGTVRWSWGLDGNHDDGSSTPDVNVQQATVNLFADMGLQPGSLQAGLLAAAASTDTTPPTSGINPPSSAVVGTPVIITGTAADVGGAVAGVEVSVDGGVTWHAASGRSSWAFTWVPTKSGSANLRSRAVDDSGNLETPSAGATVTVAPRTCPCSIWPASTIPGNASSSDTGSVELGVKFRTTEAGFILGVRFYKGPANTGTHVGNLWSSTGSLLATATFTNETATGWQQVSFSEPVAVSANTTYIASYHAPAGGYAFNGTYFLVGVDNEPLRALANGEDGPNGVFMYGTTSSFPTQTFSSTNYWVDIVFATSASVPPAAANDSYTMTQGQTLNVAAPGVLANDTSFSGNPLTAMNPTAPANGTLTLNANGSFTYTPNASFAGTDSFTYQASDGIAVSNVATVSISVTPATPPVTIFSPSSVPGTADANDSASVELGVKFRVTTPGFVSAVRFYKGSLNTGTHIGNLWTTTGTLLASGTFSSETASGWQQVNFANPVAISANTTYIASYFAPKGEYSADQNFFATGVTNGPLTALANGVDGGNGVFIYSNASGFPTQTFNASNYWVDLVFTANSSTPPAANNDTYSTAQGTALNIAAPGVLGNDTSPSGRPLSAIKVTDPANGTLTLNADGSFLYTPNSTFSGTDSFSYKASDGVSTSNVATVSITVTPAGGTPVTIWSASTVPGTADANDSGSVELGIKFRASVAGTITGVRFYKGPLNTGTHVGNLWTNTGALLATATFANETASGWQQVNFATPVAIKANTTYVASYFAPRGEYSFDPNYFATGVTNGPLTALASGVDGGNGVFNYSTGSVFPFQSFNAANYWVDLVFTPSTGSAPPIANNDSYTTAQGQTFTVTAPGILSNDSSPSGNHLSAIKVSDPANGVLTLNSDGSFSYTPNSTFSGTDTFTYKASDGVSTSNVGIVSITVTPSGTPLSLWSASTVPGTADSNDGSAVELGVKFQASVSGTVLGVRFYKGALNTGTHIGNLWSSNGTLLATATFLNESASGWQQVNFATPVAISANTTYIVSYFAPKGEYAFDGNYFGGGGITNGPLHALANSEDPGGNGVFHYGSSSGFPSQTFNAANYWVDVLFTQ